MKRFEQMTFAERIRWRIRGQWLLIVLMLAYMVIVGETGGDSRVMSVHALNVGRIIYFGGFIWIVCRLRRNQKLLDSRHRLKQRMLDEQDERNVYLHDKSGGFAMDAMLMLLLFATLAGAHYDMTAFRVSYALLIAAALLKATTYLYHSKRA